MATITAKSGVIAVVFLVMCVASAATGDKDELPASFDVLHRPENADGVGPIMPGSTEVGSRRKHQMGFPLVHASASLSVCSDNVVIFP